jgi:hypothetical protein
MADIRKIEDDLNVLKDIILENVPTGRKNAVFRRFRGFWGDLGRLWRVRRKKIFFACVSTEQIVYL